MAGNGKLWGGIVLLIVGAIFIAGASYSAMTYYQGLDTVNQQKQTRDAAKAAGLDTSEMDRTISDNQALLDTKVTFMSVCFPLSAVLLILGAALVLSWRRGKSKAAAPAPFQNPQPVQQPVQQGPPPPGV